MWLIKELSKKLDIEEVNIVAHFHDTGVQVGSAYSGKKFIDFAVSDTDGDKLISEVMSRFIAPIVKEGVE